jgi:hypothetical protein
MHGYGQLTLPIRADSAYGLDEEKKEG